MITFLRLLFWGILGALALVTPSLAEAKVPCRSLVSAFVVMASTCYYNSGGLQKKKAFLSRDRKDLIVILPPGIPPEASGKNFIKLADGSIPLHR